MLLSPSLHDDLSCVKIWYSRVVDAKAGRIVGIVSAVGFEGIACEPSL